MNIKIYTLSSTRNPNNIRYVGKSKQKLTRRLSQHLLDAKPGISTCSISNCCNHKINDVKGFKFIKYKEFMNT